MSILVELSSLTRLENVLITALRMLTEEELSDDRLTFVIHMHASSKIGQENTTTPLSPRSGMLMSHYCVHRESMSDHRIEEDTSIALSVIRNENATRDAITESSESAWIVEMIEMYMSELQRLRQSSDRGVRERVDTATRRLRLIIDADSLLAVLRGAHNVRGEYDDCASVLASVFLFFQWYSLMCAMPIDHNADLMNFAWADENRGAVVFYTRRERQLAREFGIASERGTTTSPPLPLPGVDVREINGPMLAGTSRTRLVYEKIGRVCDLRELTSDEPPGDFMISNGARVVSVDSRPRFRQVQCVIAGSEEERILTGSDKKTAHCSSYNNENDSMKKNRRSLSQWPVPAPPVESFDRVFEDATLTSEQCRVLRVIRTMLEEPGARKRVIIDGVAGAGKTFILGLMLRCFQRVTYLVKKRNFVDATLRRFEHHARLTALTIDAYLMRASNVRNLHEWLRMRRSRIGSAALQRRLLANRAPSRRGELIFVDEYSLIEASLAELLNVTLHDRTMVIVGDCCQQPAIGDKDDQAVRNLLAYERACFMYENVRARDRALLARLSTFDARDEDVRFRAVKGLPVRSTIDLGPAIDDWMLRTLSDSDGATVDSPPNVPLNFRLLPRVIVSSNAKVNYLNWAIGHSLLDRGVHGLRYKRVVVFPADCTASPIIADDPFADELFVFVGMRYRMVHATASWPVQVGSRVVVRAIETDECVLVQTDDERGALLRLTKKKLTPYEYASRWNGTSVLLYMFPFVQDGNLTAYQAQGLTLNEESNPYCYIDAQDMHARSLYTALSRFETERQILGIINCQTLQ